MDFEKKEFYGIVAKAKKQMQITIDQDCNVADTKPDVEKMIQTRGIVKIQETEMMVDRVRIKGEFIFQGLYGTNDTSAYLESLEYSLPFEEYVHIEGVLPSDYVKVKYTIDDINTILINSRKISIRVLLTFSFQITEEMKEKGIIEIHEENVSVLKKDVQITDLIVNKKDIARLKEELVLPANKANIYQILWTQVDMENLQAKIGEHMIEIQGAMKIKEKIPEAVLVFVTPPTIEELRSRLTGRGTETADVIASRLRRAAEESEGMDNYDYILINDQVEDCVDQLHQIILSERCRAQRNEELINTIQEEARIFMKGDK